MEKCTCTLRLQKVHMFFAYGKIHTCVLLSARVLCIMLSVCAQCVLLERKEISQTEMLI